MTKTDRFLGYFFLVLAVANLSAHWFIAREFHTVNTAISFGSALVGAAFLSPKTKAVVIFAKDTALSFLPGRRQ